MNGLEALPFLRREGPCHLPRGGRRKDNIALRDGPPGAPARAEGAGLHHDPHPASGARITPPMRPCGYALWQAGPTPWRGARRRRKLTMPPLSGHWMAEADTVLLEADGAKHHPARPRPLMSRCSCGQATSCWRQPGCRRWGKPLQTSASASKRPAPCWACRPNAPDARAAGKTAGKRRRRRKNVGTRAFYVILNQADDAPPCSRGTDTCHS